MNKKPLTFGYHVVPQEIMRELVNPWDIRRKARETAYKVKPGDSYASIAEEIYGDARRMSDIQKEYPRLVPGMAINYGPGSVTSFSSHTTNSDIVSAIPYQSYLHKHEERKYHLRCEWCGRRISVNAEECPRCGGPRCQE